MIGSAPSATSHGSSPPSTSLAAAVLAAVRSVLGNAGEPIALHQPKFGGNEWAYVKQCIDSGWVSSVGEYVDKFEGMLAAYTGSRFAIATVNGTSALHVCLHLAGVQPGDEVLIPSLTFIATANAVSYIGAIPHFVDSEDRSLGVDAVKVESYLTEIATIRNGSCVNLQSGRVIRVLMPMHVFGLPCDLDALHQICLKWHLTLVEDAAESLGSLYRGRHTGTFGKLAGLSFNGNKIITTGGGGAILTDDETLARRAKHLTTTARVAHKWSFIHDEVGYNYRLPNLNAALGCAQMESLPGFIGSKRHLVDLYRAAFAAVVGMRLLLEPPQTRSNYWLATLLLDEPSARNRDAILTALNAAGFMARPAWTLLSQLPMYQACPRMDLAGAEQLSARIVNIPSSAILGERP